MQYRQINVLPDYEQKKSNPTRKNCLLCFYANRSNISADSYLWLTQEFNTVLGSQDICLCLSASNHILSTISALWDFFPLHEWALLYLKTILYL